MRRFNILFVFAFILFTSCVTSDTIYDGGLNQPSKRGFHIVGAVEDFDIKTVGTRADDGDISDSHISEMTMFIFDSDKNLIQGYTDLGKTSKCSSAINIQRGNPTFLVDTEEGILADLSGSDDSGLVYYDNADTNTNLKSCRIYIVANAWHQLEDKLDEINTLAKLEAFVVEIDEDDAMSMPMIDNDTPLGFPMIGTQNGAPFDLTKSGNNENNAVATIPLKKLYSKVRFTIQVNANQVVAGQTPKFTIEKAEVFNVPTKVHLGRKLNPDDGKLVYQGGEDDTNPLDNTTDDYVNEIAGGTISDATIGNYYHYTSTPYTITEFKNGKKTIYHSISATTDDIIEFSFYTPEHKVTPNAIKYPTNIPDEAKQKYKPAGVGQSRNGDGTTSNAKIATFVRIHGSYTDHNGQILTVKYDIYLGQNNTDDFTVQRNQLLNNKLIIAGLTDHKDAYPDAEGNISIDHRVEVDDKGFNLSMERTAILDSHFEVRPLDIELSPKSQMTITIPQEYRDWVAMESDEASKGASGDVYVDTSTPRKGVRKYFTNNLVSELNTANGGTITLSNNETGATTTKTFRIWFYIDENPNVYDKTGATSPADGYIVSKEQYRVCPVQFKYMGTDKNGDTLIKDATINFQQWNLWRVWSADKKRYYDIEHEEEYLNNYASDQQYGGTQDGMPYGLEGIQLSDGVSAYWQERHTYSINIPFIGDILSFVINALDSWLEISSTAKSVFAQSKQKPYYDFYLTRDAFPVDKLESTVDKTQYARDYQGLQFNKEIAATLKANIDPKAKIDGIILTEDPKSAFAYCYHKNKRNSDGTIDIANIKWFLPAIDEIEDIALGAYDEFDQVFQNKEYWSCQPAYNYNTLRINPDGKTLGQTNSDYVWFEGEFYSDNTLRARSTSVYATSATTYTTIDSGLPNGVVSGHLLATAYQNGNVSISYSDKEINYNTDIYTTGNYRGNSARNDIARIRAVYRSGTK